MTQEQALNILKTGKNVFLTGQAGSGKTYVINQYIDYLHQHKIPVAVTASTGIAATHIGGSTIHSWSGMGIKSSMTNAQLATLRARPANKKRFKNVKVLILDEISMLHQQQFDLLDEILRYMKDEPFQPFGGMQLVLSGDFLQLPPVSRTNEPSRDRFCFMSPTWVNAEFTICYLETQYRQGDQALTSILNEIREQNISDDSISLLKEKINTYQPDEKNERTRLFTHNADVDAMNNSFLSQLATKEHLFKAKTSGKKAILNKMESNSMIPFELKLKIGAQVMFIKNDPQEEYVNGTTGTVVDFTSRDKYPIIETKTGTIDAYPADWNVEDETGNIVAAVCQVPLKLAWAVTIHKSQGMTLDSAEIDLSRTFEAGQGYVALSRLKQLDGLQLKGMNQQALQLDKLAFKADQRFKELSREAEQFNENELNILQQQFVKDFGSFAPVKESKETTYDKTRRLLEEKNDLEEISKKRNISINTIYGHLSKIKQTNPEIDIEHLKPSDEVINRVKNAIDICFPTEQDKKEFKLKPVFEQLNERIPYDEIKLAMLFIVI